MYRATGVTLLLLPLILVSTAMGFETSWQDQFGETTYTISGPDVVGTGETVEIFLAVRDSL